MPLMHLCSMIPQIFGFPLRVFVDRSFTAPPVPSTTGFELSFARVGLGPESSASLDIASSSTPPVGLEKMAKTLDDSFALNSLSNPAFQLIDRPATVAVSSLSAESQKSEIDNLLPWR